MKSPLWILNSALVVLLFIMLGIMFAMRIKISAPKSLTPRSVGPVQKAISNIDISRVYESDLFGTYSRPSKTTKEPIEEEIRVPQPPQTRPYLPTPRQTPELMPPLAIDLKGVIFNSNSIYSRAIIAEKQTKKEKLYKIGDSIEDANLIYIGPNKAILIRSNGQQETLFVTEKDAKKDPLYGADWIWASAVKKVDDSTYAINAKLFKDRVSNLAQFFDELDVTTAFYKGRILGCRIGSVAGDSLITELGLKYGDIITKINGIPTISTADRVAIYQQIEDAKNNQTIHVTLKRNNKEKELFYIIRTKEPKKIVTKKFKGLPAGTPLKVKGDNFITPEERERRIAEHTLSQAPKNKNLAQTFKQNDKKSMVKYGGRNALLQR